MPKLTDAELCRKFAIAMLQSLKEFHPDLSDWDAMVAAQKCSIEIAGSVERMVETVTRRKVV